ncbi:DUF488 family protein [Corynebacterium kroppenstedtii]|uniref:DUF488 domain-containing protein n=1 Tax=Corynebacterium kroppenstedtii (strain DSM 44385 / JCM 11950 / CIP 105744 / CCUG 35717) TaxID=645127 RepID=C4LGV6_CORK4|nr:DUF488 family protein [Corynebacterium kroppenstedtii]ACR17061.1 hypothetical protein ckrop_0275 [Corynebacterium kroppenstedtii DSM 44385]QRP11564.1 DUF488 family protein [Corynebacterium kroppenstedtii]HJD68509.1 DUF488 family protein [Corynebacterium kroppenstedtii]
MITTEKIHDQPAEGEGTRILVDRLWPRGVKKATAPVDEWLKGLAPSPELRKDWGHDPARFSEFADRYRSELDERLAAYKDTDTSGDDGDSSGSDSDSEVSQVGEMRDRAASGENIILVFAAKDRVFNHAVVLKAWLDEHTR